MSNPTLLDATELELLREIVAARSVRRINELGEQLAAYRGAKERVKEISRAVADGLGLPTGETQ